MNKNNNKLANITLILLSFMPLVESLNGMFLGHHISDAYRLMLLLIIVFFLFFYRGRVYYHSIWLFLLVAYFFIMTILQNIVLSQQLHVLLSDFKSVSRIVITPIYYGFFYKCLEENYLTKNKILNILSTYSIMYIILILLPFLFNIGYSTYDIQGSGFLAAAEGIGNKGYFVEINSLVALLLGFLVFNGEIFIEKIILGHIKRALFNLIYMFGIFLTLLISSTKTGIIFGLFYIIVWLFKIQIHKKINKKLKGVAMILLSIGMLIGYSLFSEILINQFLDLLQRGKYFFQLFDHNILQFITSSRSAFLKDTLVGWLHSPNILFLHLFGAGYYVNVSNPIDPYRRIVTEMDGFDFYFSYGLIGIFIYSSYFYTALKNIRCVRTKSIKYMVFVIFLYGLVAGHVIFNSMTGTILSILMAYFLGGEHSESKN